MNQRQIADYLLIRELGRGSMGDTFLAEHRFLKRPFIVKVLPAELSSDAEFMQRFEAEVQSLSRLEHPHIARIHNASCAEGVHFLVTEPVLDARGQTTNLGEYFLNRQYELPEEEILRIAAQLASAIDFAHGVAPKASFTSSGKISTAREAPMPATFDESIAEGPMDEEKGAGSGRLAAGRKLPEEVNGAAPKPVAHGSIKLNNIVIRETEEGPLAFLTDFGLSRIIGPLAALSRTYHSAARAMGAKSGFTTEHPDQDQYAPGPWDLAGASALQRSFCQNFLFLAPEQRVVGTPGAHPVKSDIYAFGVLLYYLLTAEFPEGYFELPSRKVPSLKWNWDLLICKTLQTDPMKRPDNLSARIEELLAAGRHVSPREQLQKLKRIAEESAMLPDRQEAAGPKPLLKPKEITRPSFEADPGAVFQTETLVAPYKPELKEEREIEPLPVDMAVVPTGTWVRGSNHGGRDEMPRHAVRLDSFAIDTHPVTNEQFALFLEAMGGEKDVNNNDIIRLRDSRIRRSGGRLTIESGYARHPVVGVTWYGAVAYAKWVGKRLPTEAEWEIASYGGREDVLFPHGNQVERTDANFFSSDTTAVMSYAPNGFGLYDMAGNVYEWCQDWYDFHYYDISVQEPDNPKGPAQGVYRVLRGGCWKSSKEDLRCAHRHRNNPGLMNGTYGFRCAADVYPE